MKALFRNTTLALTSMLMFAACTKDSLPGVSGPQSSPMEVSKIIVKGEALDLSLNAYSSSDPAAKYDLTVDGRLIESFRLPQNDNLKWHLDYLSVGPHRINIFVQYSNTNPTFSNFQFNISDGNHSQTVTSTKIDSHNYGFDLVVEK